MSKHFFFLLVLHCLLQDIWVTSPYPGKAQQQPQEQRYPFLSVCPNVFLSFSTSLFLAGNSGRLTLPVVIQVQQPQEQRYPLQLEQYFRVSKHFSFFYYFIVPSRKFGSPYPIRVGHSSCKSSSTHSYRYVQQYFRESRHFSFF